MFLLIQTVLAGMHSMLSMFHLHKPRDAVLFGRFDEDGIPAVDLLQKRRVVTQLVKDVMKTVSDILETHVSAVLGYATWFIENCRMKEDYSVVVTKLACRLITHCSLMAHDVKWHVVYFT